MSKLWYFLHVPNLAIHHGRSLRCGIRVDRRDHLRNINRCCLVNLSQIHKMATKEGIILGDSTLIFSLLYRKNQEKDVFSKK